MLTVQDAFSSYCRFILLQRATGKMILHALNTFCISYFRFPNALEFFKESVASWCDKYNIDLTASGINNSKQNGQVEKLKQLFFNSMKYNNSSLHRLKESLQFLMHGQDFKLNFLQANERAAFNAFWAQNRNPKLQAFQDSETQNVKHEKTLFTQFCLETGYQNFSLTKDPGEL